MLVLTRKLGEQVVIGDDICVTVVAIYGNRVRLGFTAPAETIIRRQELYSDLRPSCDPDSPSSDSPRDEACPH